MRQGFPKYIQILIRADTYFIVAISITVQCSQKAEYSVESMPAFATPEKINFERFEEKISGVRVCAVHSLPISVHRIETLCRIRFYAKECESDAHFHADKQNARYFYGLINYSITTQRVLDR